MVGTLPVCSLAEAHNCLCKKVEDLKERVLLFDSLDGKIGKMV